MKTCKTCQHWDTKPFMIECDGVTPIEGLPQMGCCEQPDQGCTHPTMTCLDWSPAIVSVCMICHRVIGPDQRPAGTHIRAGSLVSHGLCLICAPGYCREMGLSEKETARIINTPIHGGVSVNRNPETVSTVSH